MIGHSLPAFFLCDSHWPITPSRLSAFCFLHISVNLDFAAGRTNRDIPSFVPPLLEQCRNITADYEKNTKQIGAIMGIEYALV